MRHSRIPIVLVALCGCLVAAGGARAADTWPARSTSALVPAVPAYLLSGLPEIDSLTADSDFTVFMQEGVPAELHRRALRKLWSVDPQFASVDGLSDYAGDYTDIKSAMFAVARRMTKSGDMLAGTGVQVPAASAYASSDLPDVMSLTAESDFTIFMAEGVPAELRHRALRKLWSSDPEFAFVDGLGDYAGDYTGMRPGIMPGRPIQVALQLGTENDEFVITPARLLFETNKLYELVVTNPSETTHHLSAPHFGASVTTHEATVYDDYLNVIAFWLEKEGASTSVSFASQLARGVEISPGGEARWIFVPTRKGQFSFGCAIPSHAKAGMVAAISVEI